MPTTVPQAVCGRFPALAGALSLVAAGAAAQPSGLAVQAGAATLSQQGTTLVVSTRNGAGGYSSLAWQQFSIPAGRAVRFEQPSAASLSINRVIGGSASAIQGQLSSNGKLVLVNPAGITVGAGAVVDTAGFTASTVNGSDADFLSGRFGSGRDLAGPAADLVVEGRILARHGDVVLVGGNLRQAGGVEAMGIGMEGGRVVLRALDEVRVTGEVRARRDAVGSASPTGARGGAIDVLGARVVLTSTARLDVSGPAGGGAVRVGGDFQGANPQVPNAQTAEVAAGARITADATVQGDGGRVVVWSDGRTQSAGPISARGGPQGGDGGFVEVSGKQQLAFSSPVDTRAPRGRTGQLLLDPGDFELVPGAVDPEQTGYPPQISLADLLASDSDIALMSTGAITVSQALEWTQPYNLTLEARTLLSVNAPIRSLGGGALELRTNGYMVSDGPVASTLHIAAPVIASRITVSARGEAETRIDLQGADLQARQGALTLEAPVVTMTGNNRLWGRDGALIKGVGVLDAEVTLSSLATLRTSGEGSGGLVRGDLRIEGNLVVEDGATLRMAIGQGANDQIQMIRGAADFRDLSTLQLDLLAGASRPTPGRYFLITGDASGTYPRLAGPGASPDLRLKWGSLEALVPTVLKKAMLPEGGGGPNGWTGPAGADPDDPDCLP